MKNLIVKIVAGLACIGIGSNGYSCPVTVENNTKHPIAIAAHDGNQVVVIKPGRQAVYGSHMQHAQFYVMKEKSAGDFEARVSITQHFCSPTPLFFTAQQLLEMSSVIDREMFTVQKYAATEGHSHASH